MTYRPIINYGGVTHYGKDENGNSLSFVTEADFIFSRGSTSYSWDYSIGALRDFIEHKNTITQLYHTHETVNNYIASGGAVTIADTQTITGVKTFNNSISFSGKVTLSGGFENYGHLVIPNNSIQYNVIPTSDCNNYIIHRSREGNDLSYIQLAQLSNGKAKAQVSASTYASNGTRYTASIYVTVDRSGNASTYAPTPTDGTSKTSNQIATVGWTNTSLTSLLSRISNVETSLTSLSSGISAVETSLSSMKYVTQTYSNGTQWYRVWSDGWIEQGGYLTSSGFKTVTFLKSFSDANYSLSGSVCDENIDADCQTMGVYNKTASSVQLCNAYRGSFYSGAIYWYACGY